MNAWPHIYNQTELKSLYFQLQYFAEFTGCFLRALRNVYNKDWKEKTIQPPVTYIHQGMYSSMLYKNISIKPHTKKKIHYSYQSHPHPTPAYTNIDWKDIYYGDNDN